MVVQECNEHIPVEGPSLTKMDLSEVVKEDQDLPRSTVSAGIPVSMRLQFSVSHVVRHSCTCGVATQHLECRDRHRTAYV